MKGVVKVRKGVGNVELRDVPEPAPQPDEVIIEVKAAGICGSDIHIYYDDIFIPVNPPVVIGHEFSGVIAEVGSKVKDFKVGERVVSETAAVVCGRCRYCLTGSYNLCPERLTLGYWKNGAFTKYCATPSWRVHRLPDNIDFESAALCEPLACCVHGVLELTEISPGDTVVVTGPGAIGLLSMQLSIASGGRVVVCGTSADEHRLRLARELGAYAALNVERENALEFVRDITGGYGADVVLECSGAAPAANMGFEIVRKQGRYTQIGLFGKPITLDFEKIASKEIKTTGTLGQRRLAWERALALLERGQVRTLPLVSDRLPITDWKSGFEKFEKKEGIKILLYPVDR
ncbi:MAG: zinc-binding dehydrogenase [bacterium]